jgi:hypothetical protein
MVMPIITDAMIIAYLLEVIRELNRNPEWKSCPNTFKEKEFYISIEDIVKYSGAEFEVLVDKIRDRVNIVFGVI